MQISRINDQVNLTIPYSGVGDPDPEPDPHDPHIFGPAGSGSISQRYGSGSFPFLIKVFLCVRQVCGADKKTLLL